MAGINLVGATGSVNFALAGVPTDQTLSITQAQSKFVGAGPFGFVENPENTNLKIKITDGFLILGGDFGGVSGHQSIKSVDAEASDFLRVEDNRQRRNHGAWGAARAIGGTRSHRPWRHSSAGTDVEAIKRATDALMQTSHRMAEGAYKAAGAGAAGSGATPGAEQQPGADQSGGGQKKDDVVDAEFEEQK